MTVLLIMLLAAGGLIAIVALLAVCALRLIKLPLLAPLEPVDPEDPRLPPCVPAFFGVAGRTLTSLGFTPIVYAEHRMPPPALMQPYIAIFEHPQTNDWAVATAILSDAKTASRSSFSVDSGSRFADGTRLCTTNAWPAFPNGVPGSTMHRFPAMKDLALLHRVHRLLAQRETRSATVRHASSEGALQYFRSYLREAVDAGISAGRMRRIDDVNVGFTTKGAILGFFEETPPGKPIIRRGAVRRARTMLQELGFSPHYHMTQQEFAQPK